VTSHDSVFGDGHLVTGCAEMQAQEIAHVLVVVHDQDAVGHQS
jgi:hypothetical protein